MKKTELEFRKFIKSIFFYNSYKRFRFHHKRISLLLRTNASAHVIFCYFRDAIGNIKIEEHHKSKKLEFLHETEHLELTNDWFTSNIPYWLATLNKLNQKQSIKALEIGSWEGLSSYFILSKFKNIKLDCIDTWEGADEHKDGIAATKETLLDIESKFDRNLSVFKDRITKFKGTSYSFFDTRNNPSIYDLIYIDGSHHSDDVMIDAIKSFALLKPKGIMIFDDYFWKYYNNELENPGSAINLFLKLKRNQLKILRVYNQIIIQKLG